MIRYPSLVEVFATVFLVILGVVIVQNSCTGGGP